MATGVIRKYMDGNDSGWLYLEDATIYSGKIYYRKIGGLVFFSGDPIKLVNQLSASSYVQLHTIPDGYRPSKSCIATCYINNNTMNNKPLSIRITANGGIFLYSNNEAVPASTNIYFSATFI